jgi:hypothetical protein
LNYSPTLAAFGVASMEPRNDLAVDEVKSVPARTTHRLAKRTI